MNGTWSRVDIAGKPADVYEPPGAAGPRFGILHLHGLGDLGLRDRVAFTRVFDELGLAGVCPHGGPCWWADRVCPTFDDRVTPEKHLLNYVMPFFEQRWGLRPRAVGLLGISMGGQGALRLGFKYPHLFPAVAGIASALDFHDFYGENNGLDALYDSREQCRQDTAILHIHPSQYPPHLFFCIDPGDDLLVRGNDRLHEKLSALGVPHTTDFTTRAGGHTWDYFNHMADRAIRFLHDGLVQESRKLL